MVPFFVGRRDELRRLKDALAKARAGEGCGVLVSGEPGIGKTSLAEELAKAAAWMGVPAVWGPAIEAEGAPPFWPWRQALRALHDLGRRPDVPDLAPPDSARFPFFEAVAAALRDAAMPGGLLVVLDDLHWADAGSLRLLQVIASQLPGSRILLLGTYRPPLPNERSLLADELPALLRERAVSRLALEGLGALDTESLLLQLLGPSPEPELVRRVRDQSDGNPFYVVELAESLRAGGSRVRLSLSLRDIARRRLEGASPVGHEVLRSAAVLGREFPLDLLAAVTGAAVSDLLDSMDEAMSLRLVQELNPTTYRFAHGLLREVLYDDLPVAERARRHLLVADAIGALAPARRDTLLYAWSHHLRQALPLGDQRQALDVTLRAASAAERELAYEQAAEEYAEAARLAAFTGGSESRGRVLLSRARCLYRAGAIAASWQASQEVATAARTIGDARLLAEAALVVRGIGDTAICVPLFKLCEDALGALAGSDPVLEARLLGQMGVAGQQARVGLAEPGLADRATEAARRTGDPDSRFLALQAKEMELAGPLGLAERLALGDEALSLTEETHDPAVAVWARSWRLSAYWELGRRADLDRELEALGRAAEEAREPLGLWRFQMAQASVAVMDGRYQDALDSTDRALPIGRRGGHGDAELIAMILRTQVAMRTGAPGVEEAIRSSTAAVPASTRLWGASVLADIGRVDEARELWRMSGVEVASLPRDSLWLQALDAMARVAAAVADLEAAPTIFQAVAPFANRHAIAGPIGGYMGPVALNAGRLASLLERWDDAETLLRQAMATSAAVGSPPYDAIARWELARLLRRRGRPKDRGEAGALLDQALATARRLGMRPLEGWAAADLHELRHPDGRYSPLSAREIEVAGLVAKGLTNRAMAQHLRISERTAENHVKNILDKLGLHSRAQIAAWTVGKSAS
jgi:DNA-binding CsgD family transcriptional regulator